MGTGTRVGYCTVMVRYWICTYEIIKSHRKRKQLLEDGVSVCLPAAWRLMIDDDDDDE